MVAVAVRITQSWQPPKAIDGSEIADPVASARAAGLRYVSDTMPGVRRKRSGKGFSYLAPDGGAVREAQTIRRIRSLAIPPAWTDVWICPHPAGHLQASGRDARGRKQYRYHSRWRAVRDAVKYDRMLDFARALPRIRERTDRDLELDGLPRRKVLATVVRLLEETRIRVGNDEYRKENGSFGLTTLRNRHVNVHGSSIRFNFRGKGGKSHLVKVSDRRLVRVVKKCQDLPGQELFQHIDEDGQPKAIESDDVNQYLREIAGDDFTAKDFRTWSGTILAARFFRECESKGETAESKKAVVRTIAQVAEQLGNTPAVCKQCYIHPAVIAAYLAGSLKPLEEREEQDPYRLTTEERCLLRLLGSAA